MRSWFYIWDDLLRLLAIARVANPQIEFNLTQTRHQNFDKISITAKKKIQRC
jgi:hypothetical protein